MLSTGRGSITATAAAAATATATAATPPPGSAGTGRSLLRSWLPGLSPRPRCTATRSAGACGRAGGCARATAGARPAATTTARAAPARAGPFTGLAGRGGRCRLCCAVAAADSCAATAAAAASSILGGTTTVRSRLAATTAAESVEESQRGVAGARQRDPCVRLGRDALFQLDEQLLEGALVPAHGRGRLRPGLELGGSSLGNAGVDRPRHLVQHALDGAGHQPVGGLVRHRRHRGGRRQAPGRRWS